jgi:3-hydroxyanthranilate 3,4-dioxygenase
MKTVNYLNRPLGIKIYIPPGDYIVMVVAGPNARKDFHYNETEELFYQLEGSITIIIKKMENAMFRTSCR